MKYYRFEVTNESTGNTDVFLVRRDMVGYYWEQYVNELESDTHLTTRGFINIENEFRRYFKI